MVEIDLKALNIPIPTQEDPVSGKAKGYYHRSVYDILLDVDPYECCFLREWVVTQLMNYLGWTEILQHPEKFKNVLHTFYQLGIQPTGCTYTPEKPERKESE